MPTSPRFSSAYSEIISLKDEQSVNSGTGTAMAALSDNWGSLDGNGHLVISQSAGRNNPSMGSAAFSDQIYTPNAIDSQLECVTSNISSDNDQYFYRVELNRIDPLL